jgi:hypothetical protein
MSRYGRGGSGFSKGDSDRGQYNKGGDSDRQSSSRDSGRGYSGGRGGYTKGPSGDTDKESASSTNQYGEQKEKPKYTKTEYTEEQQQEMLNGYVELPEGNWLDLSPGDHIRYVADDLFRPGGYIMTASFMKDDFNGLGQTKCFLVSSKRDHRDGEFGHLKWSVPWHGITHVWVKLGTDVKIMKSEIERTIDRTIGTPTAMNFEKLNQRITALEAKLAKMG